MTTPSQEFESRMRRMYIDRASTIEQVQPNYWNSIRHEAEVWKHKFMSDKLNDDQKLSKNVD